MSVPEKSSSTLRSPWKTIASRIAYENPWIRVREDQVLRPDGKPGLYGVVELRPSVGVVVLNNQDNIALVGQWRYSLNRHSWEIPRGGSVAGESDILEAAQREVREEIGMLAAHWVNLGFVDVCNGVADDVQTLFLATDLTATERQLDAEEGDLIVEWRPFSEAIEMAMDGRITEVCSVAAILKVARLRANR